MKIVLVNWVRPAEGTALGGGVNGYAQQLALELAARHHDVFWVLSGQTYTPAPAGGPGACEARRLDNFGDIPVFELVNSPVISPGPCQAREPDPEVASPSLEAEFERLLGLIDPDIVHFHNIEGFSAGCVTAAGKPRAGGRRSRVVFSLHNYHTICPQVYLMQRGRVPCRDSDQGRRCPECLEAIDPGRERERRALDYGAFRGWSPPRLTPLTVRERLGLASETPHPPPPMAGAPVREFLDVQPPGREPAKPEPARERPAGEMDPLDNTVGVEPAGVGELSPHGRRRAAMVTALSGCDRVLAVSRFVAAKFAAMGVSRNVIDVLPIGTRMSDLAAGQRGAIVPTPAYDGRRPLRLAFMGFCNYFKGLHVLLDALALLTDEAAAGIDLLVAGKGVEEHAASLRALGPRLAGLAVRSTYAYHEVPWILAGRDVGVVPSVWWDNAPQTVMEFFACGLPVIASEAGGITDWVRDGENGVIVRGNDRPALAGAIVALRGDPGRLAALRAGVRPPPGVGTHAGEVEALYAGMLK